MIRKDVVLAIHKKLIAKFGGISGLRDEGLLDSALARFSMVKHYKINANLFECVAAVTYGIIKNHPFIDGNKRVGVVVCELVLLKNNYNLEATEEEKYAVFIGVASGKVTEENLSKWLSNRCKIK
jgi:death-on-curing protein